MLSVPTRSPRQQWPPRRKKNGDLSIVFQSGRAKDLSAHLYLTPYKKVKPSLYRPGQEVDDPRISTQSTHEGGTVVSPKHRPSLHPRLHSGTHFCYRLSRPQGHSAAGMITSMKNPNNQIRNRNCDHPACSSLRQATALPLPHFTPHSLTYWLTK